MENDSRVLSEPHSFAGWSWAVIERGLAPVGVESLPISDLGVDSIDLYALLSEIEDLWSVVLDSGDLLPGATLESLRLAIVARLGE